MGFKRAALLTDANVVSEVHHKAKTTSADSQRDKTEAEQRDEPKQLAAPRRAQAVEKRKRKEKHCQHVSVTLPFLPSPGSKNANIRRASVVKHRDQFRRMRGLELKAEHDRGSGALQSNTVSALLSHTAGRFPCSISSSWGGRGRVRTS